MCFQNLLLFYFALARPEKSSLKKPTRTLANGTVTAVANQALSAVGAVQPRTAAIAAKRFHPLCSCHGQAGSRTQHGDQQRQDGDERTMNETLHAHSDFLLVDYREFPTSGFNCVTLLPPADGHADFNFRFDSGNRKKRRRSAKVWGVCSKPVARSPPEVIRVTARSFRMVTAKLAFQIPNNGEINLRSAYPC